MNLEAICGSVMMPIKNKGTVEDAKKNISLLMENAMREFQVVNYNMGWTVILA